MKPTVTAFVRMYKNPETLTIEGPFNMRAERAWYKRILVQTTTRNPLKKLKLTMNYYANESHEVHDNACTYGNAGTGKKAPFSVVFLYFNKSGIFFLCRFLKHR